MQKWTWRNERSARTSFTRSSRAPGAGRRAGSVRSSQHWPGESLAPPPPMETCSACSTVSSGPDRSSTTTFRPRFLRTCEQEPLARPIDSALCDQGLLPAPQSGGNQLLLPSVPSAATPTTITEVFQALQAAPGSGRVVILFDEMECLQDFPEGEQIARNLRWAIESCPRICMVFAGAEGWYRQIKEKTSPLVHNVHAYYLKTPSRFPVETYLVRALLSPSLPPQYESSAMIRTVMDWTQSKAFYVQAVCETISERYGGKGQMPDDWQEAVKESVFESRGPVLSDFYVGHNLDALTKSILALLANRP